MSHRTKRQGTRVALTQCGCSLFLWRPLPSSHQTGRAHCHLWVRPSLSVGTGRWQGGDNRLYRPCGASVCLRLLTDVGEMAASAERGAGTRVPGSLTQSLRWGPAAPSEQSARG